MSTATRQPSTSEWPPATPIDLDIHPRSDDDALVRRMRAGDEGAFTAIFKRHHAPLLSYCRHMLGSQDEGEDALQQAFIKAHQALLGGTAPRELRPWLYAIARNCCLSAIAARRPTAPLEEHTPALEGLSEQVRQREDLRELVAAIGRLPEDQRSALLLAELDDLSHQAIATILGCPVRRVKALVYQARSTLAADRNARNASCLDIREQLSVAHGGELRRGPLRRHLNLCVGCRDFQLAVNAQRQSLAVVLPVLPSAGLMAAILGHGAAHVATVASFGGAGAGLAPAGGAAGTGVGATAGGGTGIAATGTAAGTAVGASTGAGAGGGSSVGALVGGGLATKLAVGGTIAALAAAGAVTVHHRPAHAIPQWARLQLVSSDAGGRRSVAVYRSVATYIASNGSSSPLGLGSSVGLTDVRATGSAGPTGPSSSMGPSASTGPGSSTEPSGLGRAEPLATVAGTSPPSLVPSSSPGQPAGKAAPGAGSPRCRANARARHRRAVRHRRRLRRARHRRLRSARHRARLRKALHHPRLASPRPPEPLATPAPLSVRHRKAHPTPAPGTTSATGGPIILSAGKGANGRHRHPSASTGATGTGEGNGTAAETAGPGTTSKTGSGTGTGTSGASGSGAGAGKTGSGKGAGSTGTTTSKTKTGVGGTSSTGTESTSGTGKAGEQSGAATSTSTTTGAGTAGSTSPRTKAHPKKDLVAEEQLPNL
jgi:RNA polymerase sigma factor (sigma-70 family)